MPATTKLSEITVSSCNFTSASYLIAVSTVSTLQDIRFSFAQIVAGLGAPTTLTALPLSSTVPGSRRAIFDSTVSSTAYGTTVVGGGSFTAPVYSDGGSFWRVG